MGDEWSRGGRESRGPYPLADAGERVRRGSPLLRPRSEEQGVEVTPVRWLVGWAGRVVEAQVGVGALLLFLLFLISLLIFCFLFNILHLHLSHKNDFAKKCGGGQNKY